MFESVVTVRDSIRIARPLDVVRQQFGDVRHHASRAVHPDVKFTVLSESGNECRYRHEVRVAGVCQVAEVILKREADGSQTNHFVSGHNVGMKVIHTFQPDGPDATIAGVTVQLPLRGLRKVPRSVSPVRRRSSVRIGLRVQARASNADPAAEDGHPHVFPRARRSRYASLLSPGLLRRVDRIPHERLQALDLLLACRDGGT